MQRPTFIRLENSLGAAMYFRGTPIMDIYSFRGIQLIPDHPYPYIQRTYAPEGITLDSFTVEVFDLCGHAIVGLPMGVFQVVSSFSDPDTGLPQVYWSFQPEVDFGDRLIYLRLQTGINSFVYSSPFVLSATNAEYCTRIDYRNTFYEQNLAIGVNLWFTDTDREIEVSNYTAVSTGKTYNTGVRKTAFEWWRSNINWKSVQELIEDVFLLKYVYLRAEMDGGLPVKTQLKEAAEMPRLQGRENFIQQEFPLFRDYTATFDPNAVIPEPPTPPVATITLISVLSQDKANVEYTFTYANFTPQFLTYEWSLDEEEWNSVTQGIDSPQAVQVINNNLNNFYYRITHTSGITSNTVQQPVPAITIENIISEDSGFSQSGNSYNIYYTANFSPVINYIFEATFDGTNWVQLNYDDGNPNPKFVSTSSSNEEYTQFRVRYYYSEQFPDEVVSNTYNFSFTP